MPFDTAKLATLPKEPGVYVMKHADGRILYIGKAKELRSRVKQYFLRGGDGRAMIPFLIAKVETIETIIVNSEKEALLLENTLIKTHKPPYNALLKDDKTYISLRIDKSEEWPRIELVRLLGAPQEDGLYFGPYTSAYAARKTLELIHKLFPLRQCSDEELARRQRPCLLYQIGRCCAPCVQLTTRKAYGDLIRKVTRFLRGQDKEIVQDLRKKMEAAAERLDFERAQELLEIIQHLEKTTEHQQVDIVGGKSVDVIALFREAEDAMITELVIRAGKLVGTKHYPFNHTLEADDELLTTFLLQHYTGHPNPPDEVLLPVEPDDFDILKELLSIKMAVPQRGAKKTLLTMAYKNAAAAYNQDNNRTASREKLLFDLQEALSLDNYPRRIECFDCSNLSGSSPVAAMVAYADAKPDKKRYRKYMMKGDTGSDDYAALKEVLERRYQRAREEGDLPDLIMIDGGKGQLGIAQKVLQDLDIVCDLISLGKESARHDKGLTKETVFASQGLIQLKATSPLLFFLQQVRDETHRFAIEFQKKRRSKTTFTSRLDDIPGIGPKKKKRLLQTFGSYKKICEATPEELLAVPGITKKDVENLTTQDS